MCGFAVSISCRGDLAVHSVSAMLRRASHRGPDGSGTLALTSQAASDLSEGGKQRSWIVLGHVRLAVIDTSDKSLQPMTSPCGRYSMVFNGEIYNYVELRHQLVQSGIRFQSDGDTEVVLQALIKWGNDAFRRLRGMFALVFVDHDQRKVTAARDRYGIKPLYYWNDGTHLHFASEIKQFTVHPKWKSHLNYANALQFLLYGLTDCDSKTLFEGVHHISPGKYAVIEAKRDLVLQQSAWWNPTRLMFSGSYEEAVSEYRKRFNETLSLHRQCDVKMAACLSGGLDSTAIVSSLSELTGSSDITRITFTAISENPAINEKSFADAVNKATGTQANYVLPTAAKLWCDLDRLVLHQDEPFGSTTPFAQWCVFEAMQQAGIKVALDGQGADEQLGGYNAFITRKILDDVRLLRFGAALHSYSHFAKTGRVSLRDLALDAGYRFLPRAWKSWMGQQAGLASQNAGGWIQRDAYESVDFDDPFETKGFRGGSRQLSREMVDRIGLPMLFRIQDRNSMAFGVETRVPFADHELMEFGLSLPSEFLIRNGFTKSVLRDSVRGRLPQEVLWRRDKIGFGTNEREWLSESSSALLAEITEGVSQSDNFFSPELPKMVERLLNPEASASPIPWRVISFLRWKKVFGVRG